MTQASFRRTGSAIHGDGHGRYLMFPATLKMGRYMATMNPPTMPPRNTIMSGSIMLVRARHRDVDLVVVEVGDLVEHLVHGAGGLADADHLHHHGREDLGLGERAGDVLALGDARRAP